MSGSLSAFPYIGGKTNIANWILDHLPDHHVYVEPFGGAAAILLNKPRSQIEVYNDVDGDVVHFFDVARDRPEELIEWVRRAPFAEELHDRWKDEFYAGERPDGDIERAGRFLLLRYTQFGGKYHSPSGFSRDTLRTRVGESRSWMRVPEKIKAVCERLQGVSIQCGDFREVIERYDSPETLFYCDPPYLNKEDLYPGADGFSHKELAAALSDVDGFALVSYSDRPDGLYSSWHEVTRESYHNAGARGEKNSKQVNERLLMNFDPSEVPKFVGPQQTTLTLGEEVGGDSA